MIDQETLLEMYEDSHRLAVEVHRMTLGLPAFEEGEEGSRIRRSSKSIPVHIRQAAGRVADEGMALRFLIYAFTSADETIEHLKILSETKSLKPREWVEYFLERYTRIRETLESMVEKSGRVSEKESVKESLKESETCRVK